jgi:hypothetical protein
MPEGTDLPEGTSYIQEKRYDSDPGRLAMRSHRWGAPVALAAVVAGVSAGAVWLASGSGSTSGAPALLHLTSGSGERASATSADAAEPAAGDGTAAYKLVGTLPDGRPGDRPIYRFDTATPSDAARVAEALGVDGAPQHVDGGWVVKDGDSRLVVREDGSWSYGPGCGPDVAVSSKDLTYECAVASSGGVAVAVEPDDPAPDADSGSTDGSAGTGDGSEPDPGSRDCPSDTKDCEIQPVPEPLPAPEVSPGPSESEARAVADRVLTALGMADARVTVWPGDPTASVQASAVVDGMDTVGLTTYLQVDGDGDIAWADGRLPNVVRGADYPVISASEAFDLLLEQPRIMMELCMQRPDGEPGCAEVPPAEVTGGHLGLLLSYDGDRPVLVPAWLFDVKGQPEPAAQIAIDPEFLAPPPAVDDGTSDDGSGGEPKSVPPGEPVPVEGGGSTGSPGGPATIRR